MAAPTPSARVTPTAWKEDQGFRIQVTNSVNPAIALWEIEVTPQGVEGGDPIDTSNQFNVKWHTKRPRALVNAEGGKMKCAVCAGSRHEFEALVNIEGVITEHLPDGSTECYYGYYKSIKFDAFKEGERPTCEVEIVETDFDPVNAVEAGPVFTGASGTAG